MQHRRLRFSNYAAQLRQRILMLLLEQMLRIDEGYSGSQLTLPCSKPILQHAVILNTGLFMCCETGTGGESINGRRFEEGKLQEEA